MTDLSGPMYDHERKGVDRIDAAYEAWDEASPVNCVVREDFRSIWMMALAAVRAEAVPEATEIPRRCPTGNYEYRGWNDCRAAMLEALEKLEGGRL